MTLADLQNLAAANNPTIAAAEALIRQQQGLLRQETLYPNPTVGYLRSDPDQPGKSATQGVFLSQDIVTAGKLGLAGAAQREDVEARRWQLTAQRGRVANDVRIRYYDALGAQQTVRATEEVERLAEEGVRAAEDLVKAKQTARLDVIQAELQLNAVRTAVQDAKYRHQAAWRQLANVVGVPDLQPAPLAGDLAADAPQLNWEESLQRLLASSPVLKAQEATIRAAGFDLKLARAQAIPNLNVQVVIQRDRVEKFTSVSPLVSVPLPIFNRNQGNIQNMAGLFDQQRKEYERITLALRDQLAAAFQQYQSARGQAERLKAEIIPRAKENLDLTTKGFKGGQFDIARVLAARQTYFETNTAYIDALTAMNKVAAEIEGLELTGGLNPTEIGTALQTPLGPGGTGSRSVLLQQLQQRSGGGSQLLPGALQGR
ncbi:MAG: TolC family protein [Gemmataceae bacterium]|nr:TolC family protein [Gemmataceae bacterium]